MRASEMVKVRKNAVNAVKCIIGKTVCKERGVFEEKKVVLYI